MGATPSGKVVTLYSHKGGVGRSSAVANVGWRLANKHGLRVVIVDFDLEAPGLHRFFNWNDQAIQQRQARGVVDYLADWTRDVENNAAQPPDITTWPLPVTDEGFKPAYGSLSLLVAGCLGEAYEKKLSGFDWASFYREHAGGRAIEHLRDQLRSIADVVLIDSRTGLTDIGGVCTLQLPDAVVLMTAANEQSLDGVTRVAGAIARRRQEPGRAPSRTWLVVSRVSRFEEAVLARRWFETHEERFQTGVTNGLWTAVDHPRGLDSHTIPYSGLWSFGEQLITNPADPSDLLAHAYDNLSERLAHWAVGTDARGATPEPTEREPSLAELRARVEEAQSRQDFGGLSASLRDLAQSLMFIGELSEASVLIARAIGLAQGQNDNVGHVLSLLSSTNILWSLGHTAMAAQEVQRAVSFARATGLHALIPLGMALDSAMNAKTARLAEDGLRAAISEASQSSETPEIQNSCWVYFIYRLVMDHRFAEARKTAVDHLAQLSGPLDQDNLIVRECSAIALLCEDDPRAALQEFDAIQHSALRRADFIRAGTALAWMSEAAAQLRDDAATIRYRQKSLEFMERAGVSAANRNRVEAVLSWSIPRASTASRFDVLHETIGLYPAGRFQGNQS